MRDMFNLMKQAQEMQGQLKKIQEELEAAVVTGTAAGGMVSVEVNGHGLVQRVKIDRSVVNPDDVGELEDLVAIASADAQKKAKELSELKAAGLTAGLNLPFKLPF